jgi:hypothetical protein
MIAEQRDLSSRAGQEGARARRLAKAYTLRKKRSEAAESLGCLSEGNLRVTVGDRINTLSESRDAGDPHVRFDERDLETELLSYRARSRLYHEVGRRPFEP